MSGIHTSRPDDQQNCTFQLLWIKNMECEVNTCCGGPAYDTPEGMEKRRKGARILRVLSLIQIFLGGLTLILGLASLGVAARNPSYPLMNGYAVVTGILILIGGVCARKATADVTMAEVDRRIRSYVVVHYVMNITCLTFAGLQVGFTAGGIIGCFSNNQKSFEKCQPFVTANEVLGILVIALGTAIYVTCIIGSVFFCVYARPLGYTNKIEAMNNMQREITSLRQQVAAQQIGNYPNDQYKNTYSTFGNEKS